MALHLLENTPLPEEPHAVTEALLLGKQSVVVA